jgi:hypothetical protein
MTQTNQQLSIQPKRARTDRLTPPLPRPETKIDVGACDHDQGLNNLNDGNRGAETCFIPKVIHGSAVEPGYIVPPRTGRKDFIWVTVSNRNLFSFLIDYRHSLSRHRHADLLKSSRSTRNFLQLGGSKAVSLAGPTLFRHFSCPR